MFSGSSLGRHLSLIFLFIVFLLRHYVVTKHSPPHRWSPPVHTKHQQCSAVYTTLQLLYALTMNYDAKHYSFTSIRFYVKCKMYKNHSYEKENLGFGEIL